MIIPGFIISILTFPGVIIHELAHEFCCRLCGLLVLEVKYFTLEKPMSSVGYVIHESSSDYKKNIIIGICPFFVNTIIGVLIALPATFSLLKFDSFTPVDIFLFWFGISIAMHSFPSTGDAQGIWNTIMEKTTPLWVKILTVPVVGLIYLCTVGSVMWLDLIYGVAVSFGSAFLIIKLFL